MRCRKPPSPLPTHGPSALRGLAQRVACWCPRPSQPSYGECGGTVTSPVDANSKPRRVLKHGAPLPDLDPSPEQTRPSSCPAVHSGTRRRLCAADPVRQTLLETSPLLALGLAGGRSCKLAEIPGPTTWKGWESRWCRSVADVAGENTAIRKDVVKHQSRRSGVGSVVAKHPPSPFISPSLRLLLKDVQKIRTTMNEEKWRRKEHATHRTTRNTLCTTHLRHTASRHTH